MNLSEARAEIDAVNVALVPLLERRLDAVCHVMAYKREHSMAVLDSNREQAILAAIAEYVQNPEYKEPIKQIFQDIMDITKDYEQAHLNQED